MLKQNVSSRGKLFAIMAGVLFLFAFLCEIPWQHFYMLFTRDDFSIKMLIMALVRPVNMGESMVISHNRYVIPFLPYFSAIILAVACLVGKRNAFSVAAIGVSVFYHGVLSLRHVLGLLISNMQLFITQSDSLNGHGGVILLSMLQRWNVFLSFLLASIVLLLMALLVAIPFLRKKCGFLRFIFFLPALILLLSNFAQTFLRVCSILYSALILNASISFAGILRDLPWLTCCDVFYLAAVFFFGLWLALGTPKKVKAVNS